MSAYNYILTLKNKNVENTKIFINLVFIQQLKC